MYNVFTNVELNIAAIGEYGGSPLLTQVVE